MSQVYDMRNRQKCGKGIPYHLKENGGSLWLNDKKWNICFKDNWSIGVHFWETDKLVQRSCLAGEGVIKMSWAYCIWGDGEICSAYFETQY